MYKFLIKLKIIALLLIGNTVFAKNKKLWVYFDLGNTIIDTKSPEGMHYYNGTKEYLKELRRNGFKIGIISNIPETFGMSYEEKLQTLKDFIREKWNDEEEFDWTLFDHIFLPLNNSELKPADVLYLRAMQKADFCPMVYISEDKKEVTKARELGLAAHLYDETSDNLYLKQESIEQYILENYKNKYSMECL